MAYQIKSIRYQTTPRKILLQNKNGPCPLLAAANALLLRGVITLSSECIRNGVASTDDVVNMLADRALVRSQQQRQQPSSSFLKSTKNNNNSSSNNNHNHGEYHLNEVLSTLPTLQNGMDVNPQFHSCTSIEYTHNLSTLDLLGVELVHGWLLDPQDEDSIAVIGKKSYNELIEMVIGIEGWRGEVERLEGLIAQITAIGTAIGDCSTSDGTKGVDLTDQQQQSQEEAATVQQQSHEEAATLQQQLSELQHKLEEASLQISRGNVANTFLTSTSHQLTYHGLAQLHTHMDENSLQVFFRNNHFGTITKHNGILYLLVTDLGYANTPEIIWEKLDSIDGDTEYVNEYFQRPTPREEMMLQGASTTTVVDPEVLLAQRSQAESDYQLAVAMSRGETMNVATASAATATASSSEHGDVEEGKLIQAAKELSLRTYNGDTNATIAINPTTTTTSTTAQTTSSSQLESDHQMALAFQRHEEQLEHESEQLARQLEALDRQEVQLQQQRRQQGRSNGGVSRRRQVNNGREVENGKKSSGCVIS